MDESLKIMAVMCHPADAIDHAGGTLCLHAQRGDQVTMVVCTHGVDTHHTRRNELIKSGRLDQVSDLDEAIREKEEEARRGMEILGVRDVRFLRLKDDVVIQSRELIEAIAKELADVRPHLLILHNPTEELGFAHQETAEAALRACDLVKTSHYVQDAGDPVTPAQIFFITMYGHTNQLSAEGRRFANVLVDISPVVEKKARALDCVASQYYTGESGPQMHRSHQRKNGTSLLRLVCRGLSGAQSPRLLPSSGQRVPHAPSLELQEQPGGEPSDPAGRIRPGMKRFSMRDHRRLSR